MVGSSYVKQKALSSFSAASAGRTVGQYPGFANDHVGINFMRTFLIISILFLSCSSKDNNISSPSNKKYFSQIQKNDIKLDEPNSGDWRFTYKEDSQLITHYIARKPKIAKLGITKLYLQPIGFFSDDQLKIIELDREYLQIFFQLSTIVLEPISDISIPDSARRKRVDGVEQINTQFILNYILKGKIPENGYALMAITEKDLYPNAEWNFVFGQASYADRVGVSSLYRLGNKPLDNFTICLKRILNISSHEIGHMFSITHCVLAKCVMNGANNLNETDLSPNRLCSECQKKLFWNIGYKNDIRLNQLSNFFKENKLKEDFELTEKDLKSLD